MDIAGTKVSIVLPTFNGAKYIRQAIDSCLNQTHRNLELVVVDDCSKDETPEIIQSFQDPRVIYLRHENNLKLPAALNTGFQRATGEYMTWTSDDNYYAPEAIAKMLTFLQETGLSYVYCDYYKFKGDDLAECELVKLPENVTLSQWNNNVACTLYSRKVKDTVGDYDPETFLVEDYDHWIRVSKKFPMGHLAEALYYYRVHPASLYNSRYCEVKIVQALIELRYDIITPDKAAYRIKNLIAKKGWGGVFLNKILLKMLSAQKITRILKRFKQGSISFSDARLQFMTLPCLTDPQPEPRQSTGHT